MSKDLLRIQGALPSYLLRYVAADGTRALALVLVDGDTAITMSQVTYEA